MGWEGSVASHALGVRAFSPGASTGLGTATWPNRKWIFLFFHPQAWRINLQSKPIQGSGSDSSVAWVKP